MSEKQYPYVRVKDSEYRREVPEDSIAAGNAFGTVVCWDEASGKNIPVICMHGGSGWLCPECADGILATQ